METDEEFNIHKSLENLNFNNVSYITPENKVSFYIMYILFKIQLLVQSPIFYATTRVCNYFLKKNRMTYDLYLIIHMPLFQTQNDISQNMLVSPPWGLALRRHPVQIAEDA